MYAIIFTAIAFVFTIFNYDSFLPAVHHMSQSLYENTLHRWHVPPSIGANTTNLNQVVQTFNDSSANANHSLSGTAPTITFNNETVQANASTNKLYEIEVNKADFDNCSKATINYNDIIPTSNINNELTTEVIMKSRKVVKYETAEKKPEAKTKKVETAEMPEEKSSKVESETAEKEVHRGVQFKCDKSGLLLAVAIAVVYVKFLRPENSSTEPIEESLKSPPTETEEEKKKKCLKSPSTEEEKKPFEIHQSLKSPSTEAEKKKQFIQFYTQEMYHQLPFTTSENSQDEYCFTTQPTSDNSSDLSLKEAPATPPYGFVEHELACIHLSDHLIGLMDWSQYYKHFQPGEVDMFEVAKEFEAPLNPADILVEVTTDSTETPEEKLNEQAAIEDNTNSIEPLEETSNEQAGPAITAIESNTYSIEPLEEKTTTHSEPADEILEEKPIHATHSTPANLTDEVKADSIEQIERRRHYQTGSSDESTNFTDEDSSETNVQVEEVKPKESEKIDYCQLISNGEFKNDDAEDLLETSLYELLASITHWSALEPLEQDKIDNLQQIYIETMEENSPEAYDLSRDGKRFRKIVQHFREIRELINLAIKKLYMIKDKDYSQVPFYRRRKVDLYSLQKTLDKIHRKEFKLEMNRYEQYSDIVNRLILL